MGRRINDEAGKANREQALPVSRLDRAMYRVDSSERCTVCGYERVELVHKAPDSRGKAPATISIPCRCF